MAELDWFRVVFVSTTKVKYEVTGQATTEVEAVHLADQTLEYVERIGIRDVLGEDGLSVTPPAELRVERIQPQQGDPGFGVVITHPDGTITRK